MLSIDPALAPAPTVLIVSEAVCCTPGQRRRDIYESHRHHVYSVAYYMTGNEMDAENILEATFLRVFQGAPVQPGLEQIDRALLAELQKQFSFAATATEDVPSGGQDAFPLGNVRRTELEEAVWGLPETERFFFLLRDVEGLSLERIAQLVSFPVAAVRQTLHAARLRLRQQLSLRTVAACA
ncbi:MAG: RNA polymerase sigma factor [Acidobacteriaceae bacterium]